MRDPRSDERGYNTRPRLSHGAIHGTHDRVAVTRIRGLFLLPFILPMTLALGAGTDGMLTGLARVKSPGPPGFGPDGILFLDDSAGANVFALDRL
jgi:hypothetical protein